MRVTMRPSGPLPPSVYWLRRGALALVAVGVVAVVIALVAVHHHSAATPAKAPPTSPGKPAGRTPAATTSSNLPTSPAAASTSRGAPACVAADLSITVTTSARTYPSGSTAAFTAAVHTTTPCVTATPSFEVTSGPERIWDSADCTAKGSTIDLEVRTGAISERWNLKRSAPGCATVFGTTTATTGTYHVTATVAGVTSAPVRFAIS